MKVLASVVLGLSATLAHGWWDVGHQTIGAIAQASMKNEHSIKQMKNIMSYLDATYNDAHNDELVGDFDGTGDDRPEAASRNLVDAARWPDIIKSFYNVKLFDTWHYVNQKYDPDNLDVNNTGCGTDADVNAVTQTEFLENEGYNVDFKAANNVTNFEEVLQVWMDESNELAVETYERIPLDSTVDEDTLDWVEQKSKERVVLG
eukprot:Awhi_evm1s592